LLLPEQLVLPFFILDEGLNPHIARKMAELEYPIKYVRDEFGNPPGVIEDPTIINHIADHYGCRGVWITKDTSAKRVHMNLIKARRISVVWIQQQKLSTQQQHRIITHGFARVYQDLVECHHAFHYLVTFYGVENREQIKYKQILKI
jgi:hypothetical protein